MKKRAVVWVLFGLACYAALLGLLTLAESAAPASGIRNMSDAFWFSLVTMTTVGYGDLVPVTAAGRAIGLVFLLMSIGLMASLLTLAWNLIREKGMPNWRMRKLRGRRCFLFSEANALSEALARDLAGREKDGCFVFCGTDQIPPLLPKKRTIATTMTVAETARKAGDGGEKAVFLMGADEAENRAEAKAMAGGNMTLYCRGTETADMNGVCFFDDAVCAARAFWRKHAIQTGEEEILLAGSGKLAAALLDQAVIVNCRVPFRKATYHLSGPWDEYRRRRYVLCGEMTKEDGAGERLIFHDGPWNADPELLERADRIILCDDDPRINGERAAELFRCFPVTGTVYAAAEEVPEPGIAFGRPEEIATAEIVMRSALDRRAREMNNIYGESTGDTTPWEALPPFLKNSNRAAADHLETKISLLLSERAEADGRSAFAERKEADGGSALAERKKTDGRSDHTERDPESEARRRAAAAAWETIQDREPFRENEHVRWERFYRLNNWRRGPEKDSRRRLHPDLVPYGELTEEEKEKDDYAWLLIGRIGDESYDGGHSDD